MGEANKNLTYSPSLGKRLLAIQQEDFQKTVEYLRGLRTSEELFSGHTKSLLRCSHKVAFTMHLWDQRLTDVPQWVLPYLRQLSSDTIQLVASVTLGSRRTLHLYERASIENFLRYIYFFDHPIEHILLQTQPKRFQSFDSLIEWIKNYPKLGPYRENVSYSCDELTSKYSELSRTVHGTTISDQELLTSLKSLHKPIDNPINEMNLIKSIFRNIFLLLSLFHWETFHNLSLDEQTVICQHFGDRERKILSGLNR